MRILSLGVLLIAACAFVAGCTDEGTKAPVVKVSTSKTGDVKATTAKASDTAKPPETTKGTDAPKTPAPPK